MKLNHSRPLSENKLTKQTIKNYILKKFSHSELCEFLEDLIKEINKRKRILASAPCEQSESSTSERAKPRFCEPPIIQDSYEQQSYEAIYPIYATDNKECHCEVTAEAIQSKADIFDEYFS